MQEIIVENKYMNTESGVQQDIKIQFPKSFYSREYVHKTIYSHNSKTSSAQSKTLLRKKIQLTINFKKSTVFYYKSSLTYLWIFQTF